MKLTNYIRDAFIAAAMNDVPKIDYEQQIRDLVEKKRKAFLKPLGLDKAESFRLNSSFVCMPGSVPNMYLFGVTPQEATTLASEPDVKQLCNALEAQNAQRDHLRTKLRAIISGCNTRKQAVELLPEFEKYLPTEEAKTSNLPAISNVVGEFVRAGWPKKSKAKAAA